MGWGTAKKKKKKGQEEEKGWKGKNVWRCKDVEMVEVGTKAYLHGPMDYAKTLNLQFRVGDLDLSERRNRYASS